MGEMSSPLEYLELLAREAAAIEFERPLGAARAAGLPAAASITGASLAMDGGWTAH